MVLETKTEDKMASYLANAYFLSVKKHMGEAAAIRVMQHAEMLRNMSVEELEVMFPKPKG